MMVGRVCIVLASFYMTVAGATDRSGRDECTSPDCGVSADAFVQMRLQGHADDQNLDPVETEDDPLAPSTTTTTAPASCKVPFVDGVKKWTGENCHSGSVVVRGGTTCRITAAAGYNCKSPGMCTSNGEFEQIGACVAITCKENEYVKTNSCTECPIGKKTTAVMMPLKKIPVVTQSNAEKTRW